MSSDLSSAPVRAKAVSKKVGKGGSKRVATTIPVSSAFVGLGLGACRFVTDDGAGTSLEVSSGVASTLPEAVFQVSVKTLEDDTIQLDVRSSSTINEIQNMIQTKTGRPACSQRLIFRGRPLMDEAKSLSSYGIRRDSNLYLLRKMPGGFHLDN
ncbi:uncharacterized protein [Amphiura filiformis]|uniref:uncharacterized protein n=1 Tax=Amphiura filiformis TaxID=82378 RepID=UPI003B227762